MRKYAVFVILFFALTCFDNAAAQTLGPVLNNNSVVNKFQSLGLSELAESVSEQFFETNKLPFGMAYILQIAAEKPLPNAFVSSKASVIRIILKKRDSDPIVYVFTNSPTANRIAIKSVHLRENMKNLPCVARDQLRFYQHPQPTFSEKGQQIGALETQTFLNLAERFVTNKSENGDQGGFDKPLVLCEINFQGNYKVRYYWAEVDQTVTKLIELFKLQQVDDIDRRPEKS